MKFTVKPIQLAVVESNLRYLRDGRKVELIAESERYCTVREVYNIRDDDDYDEDHCICNLEGSPLRGGEPFFVVPSDLCNQPPAELNCIIHDEIKKAEERLASLTNDIEEARKSYRDVSDQVHRVCVSANIINNAIHRYERAMDALRKAEEYLNATAPLPAHEGDCVAGCDPNRCFPAIQAANIKKMIQFVLQNPMTGREREAVEKVIEEAQGGTDK